MNAPDLKYGNVRFTAEDHACKQLTYGNPLKMNGSNGTVQRCATLAECALSNLFLALTFHFYKRSGRGESVTVMKDTQMTATQPMRPEKAPKWKGPFWNVLFPNVRRQKIGIA